MKGENGCGKSTLIKILMGMYVDEYQGNIIWNDTENEKFRYGLYKRTCNQCNRTGADLIADTIYNNNCFISKDLM